MVKKKTVNLDKLRLYDFQELYKGLTRDWAFKRMFGLNPKFLCYFLNATLNLNLAPEDLKINNNELHKDKEDEQKKIVDILVRVGKYLFIDIELNSCSFEYCKTRNIAYVDKIYGSCFNKGTSRKEMNKYKVIQLNINTIDDDIKFEDEEIFEIGKKSGKIYLENKIIYLKSLAKYRHLYYNEGVRTDEAVWLNTIGANGFVATYEILSNVLNDEELYEFMEGVTEMFVEDFKLHEWLKDEWDNYVRGQELEGIFKKGRQEGRQEGHQEGRQDGIKIGLFEGRREGKIELINNMLQEDLSYNLISKITGFSVQKIKEIESQNQEVK